MKFYSSDVQDYGVLSARFTKDGDDISPVFHIEDVPANTKGLVLIMHDVDSPGGKEWTHWLVWNIPPTTTTISSVSLPKNAVEGMNDFGDTGYGGPFPTVGSGDHRYIFSLYALDTALSFEKTTTREQLLQKLAGHINGQSMWVGIYRRD